MKRIIDVMCRCHLFDGIPEDKYKNVLNCLNAQLKTYAKDAVILHIGEQQGRPGVVVSGTLRLALYSEDGNLLTIDRLSAGQIFGETLACANKQESPVQIDALSDAEVLYLSFDPLLLEQGTSCPHKMQVTAICCERWARAISCASKKCASLRKIACATSSSSIFKVLPSDRRAIFA